MADPNNMGYLAHMIYQIINHQKTVRASKQFNQRHWSVFGLSGGTELWWDGTSQLMALRLNKPLQTGEAKTFEVNIRKAGYTHSKAADVIVAGDLNSYHGVAWKILAAVPEPTKPTAAQESLF